ncbi:MAG: hypothetical protein AAGH92_04860 [Planctomycetota bacterium]
MNQKTKDREFMHAPTGKASLINGLNAVILALGGAAVAIFTISITSRNDSLAASLAALSFACGLVTAVWTVVRNMRMDQDPSRPKLLKGPLIFFACQAGLLAASVVRLVMI